MFENLVNQPAAKLISQDIKNNKFARTVLFYGNDATGKLSAALETARVFSCTGSKKGVWTCECPSCLRHKSLICSNLLLLGPRDCSLEISAAKDSFTRAYRDNASFLNATRYLFLRSVRKLTLRFSAILLSGDNNISKIGSVLEEINDNLELLDFPRELPPFDEAVKICESLEKLSFKLESDFLYDSVPINQIRNMEEWAHIKSEEGKKTIIIENADRMQTGVRNALLKILEEPPEDCIFILLTSNKNAIMQTILSRVRPYNFKKRNLEGEQNVIKRVFHNEYFNGEISDYLQTFLPVPSSKLKEESEKFYNQITHGQIPETAAFVKECGNFEPRIELKIFLSHILNQQKKLLKDQAGCEASVQTVKVIQNAWENVTLYNLSVTSALEILVRDISKINITYGRILCADM